MVLVLAQCLGTEIDCFEVSQNQGGKEPRDLKRSPCGRWIFIVVEEGYKERILLRRKIIDLII